MLGFEISQFEQGKCHCNNRNVGLMTRLPRWGCHSREGELRLRDAIRASLIFPQSVHLPQEEVDLRVQVTCFLHGLRTCALLDDDLYVPVVALDHHGQHGALRRNGGNVAAIVVGHVARVCTRVAAWVVVATGIRVVVVVVVVVVVLGAAICEEETTHSKSHKQHETLENSQNK